MTHPDPETIDVRADEKIDTSRLEPYLRERLPKTDGPLEVSQFGGGHANLTYLLAFGPDEYVLRRPPMGPVAPSAHDMKREHRVQSALYKAFALAPRSFLYCDDPDIIGADFHVSERRSGFVIRGEMPERFADDPALNQRIGSMLIDTLADLHSVDPTAVGLEGLGKPDGFVKRQLDGWTKRWHAAKDKDLPDIDQVLPWLQENLPSSKYVTLLHNDFKLDNVLLSTDDPAKPTAVLDWDMCTLGDPLMDLGHMLNYWTDRTDGPEWRSNMTMPTWRDGFPTRTEVVARYADKTGFDVSAINWYFVFGSFKLAVILQQIYIRYLRGQTKDKRFSRFDERVAGLAQRGAHFSKTSSL